MFSLLDEQETYDIVSKLLERDPKISLQNINTIMSDLISSGSHKKTISLLVKDSRILLTQREKDFFLATIYSNNFEFTDLFLQLIKNEKNYAQISDIAVTKNYKYLVECLILENKFDSSLLASDIITKKLQKSEVNLVEILLTDKSIDPSNDNNSAIYYACVYSCVDIFKLLLTNDRVKSSINFNNLVSTAVFNDKIEMVKILLDDVNIDVDLAFNNNYCLRMACRNKNLQMFKLLLFDRRLRNTDLILEHFFVIAIEWRGSELVTFLLERGVDPAHENNHSIIKASISGCTDIVKILLKYRQVDPSVNDNLALISAIQNNHIDIVELLISDHRVKGSYDYYKIINKALLSCRYGNNNYDIGKLLLSDNTIDFTKNNYQLVKNMVDTYHIDMIVFLLENNRFDPSFDNNYLIRHRVLLLNYEIMKLLLSYENVDPSACDNYCIKYISNEYCFKPEIMNLLLKNKKVDPSAEDNISIKKAMNPVNFKNIKLLLTDKRVDPTVDNYEHIKKAMNSKNFNKKLIKLLLKDNRIDPTYDNSFFIRYASQYGMIDVVEILLMDKRSDPGAKNNYAIRKASKFGHYNIVNLLRKDSRTDIFAKNYQVLDNCIKNYSKINSIIGSKTDFSRSKTIFIELLSKKINKYIQNKSIIIEFDNNNADIIDLFKEKIIAEDNKNTFHENTFHENLEQIKRLMRNYNITKINSHNLSIKYTNSDGGCDKNTINEIIRMMKLQKIIEIKICKNNTNLILE